MKIDNRTCIVYDVEIFRNCFTCALYNTENFNIQVFEVSERTNDLSKIINYFSNNEYIFIGYNNHHFDDPIINYILMYYNIMSTKYYNEITISLYNLAQIIIHDDDYSKWKTFKYAKLFKSIDLLTMHFSKALRVSLKEMQITLMYKTVKEFDIDWKTPIHVSQLDRLIQYNINDILSTNELLNQSKKDIDLRLDIKKEYGIDVLSKDGMKIGIAILQELYSRKSNRQYDDFRDLKTIYPYISLSECILPFIKFENKNLSDLLTELKSKTIYNTKSELKYSVIFDNKLYTIGTGGLHTKDDPCIITPNKDQMLIDSDVNSYYPSLLIKWNFYPKHLGVDFLKVYESIYNERLEAKKLGNKVVAETLKLSLNGTYGNLINEYSWLFDRKAAMCITVNGQLFLLMLAEMLTKIGCKVVSANTDGITCMVPKEKLKQHSDICEEWCNITKMSLEHVEYEKIIRYAVNDYIAIKKGFTENCNEKEYIKEKGLFISTTRKGKGLSPLIIPIALKNYFIYDIKIEDTVKKCKDIKLFLMAEKTGKQWNVEHNGVPQQRVNRFVASINAPFLMKWKPDERDYLYNETTHEHYVNTNKGTRLYQNMLVDSGVLILNDLTEIKPIEEYKLNYPYYLSKIRKLIEEIQPRQLTLF